MMTMRNSKPAAALGGPTTPAEKSWIPILVDWKKSGLGPREFCRRRRLRESAFWFWKNEIPDRQRRRREERQAGSSNRALRILPVRVVREPAFRVPIEVLAGGRTLRIPGDFDQAVLRKVLGVLESRP
jgi:hypothetical protein